MRLIKLYQKFLLCYFIATATTITALHAQSQEKIYALMMLNFAKGIKWPSNNGDFVIGIMEYPPLAQELRTSSGNLKLGNQKVVIKEYTNTDEIEKCNMIFLPAYKAKLLPDILTRLGETPSLIITNKSGYAQKGSCINLLLMEGKLKYEINCKNIERKGMKISSNLKSMGIVVE